MNKVRALKNLIRRRLEEIAKKGLSKVRDRDRWRDGYHILQETTALIRGEKSVAESGLGRLSVNHPYLRAPKRGQKIDE